MTTDERSEVEQILKLQSQIEERLNKLGFLDDLEARSNIIHHLAEAAVIGKKLEAEILPAFLNCPLDDRERIGESAVDMQCELAELREALEDMEPALIRMMNFLTRDSR
jgi:hypothetical protein